MYLIYSMKKISRLVLVALAASCAIDFAGFAFGLFYAGLFYDNIAHFLTTFSLVAVVAELYFRRELGLWRGAIHITPGRALLAGAALALAGGIAWEAFEALLNLAFPKTIYNPPIDSLMDTAFGIAGGALGLWQAATRIGLTR